LISKQYIESLIRNEIHSKSDSEKALTLFQNLKERKNPKQLISVFEIGDILGSSSETKEIYQLAFRLANLSIPVFIILVEFDDSHSQELFDDDYTIHQIFDKKPLEHPDTGVKLTFDEYKDSVHFLFKLNEMIDNDNLSRELNPA
jgi:hypothetical protein